MTTNTSLYKKSGIALVLSLFLSVSKSNAAVDVGANNQNVSETTSVVGNNNNAGGSSNGVIIGNGSSLSNSLNGIVIGSDGSVSNGDGIAIGGGTSTGGGIAIGFGSSASRADEINVGDRQITGVKAGTADTDAVNVSQLNSKTAETLNEVNIYTVSKVTETLNSNNSYTDSKSIHVLNGANEYTDNVVRDGFQEYYNQFKSYTNKKATGLNKKIDDNYNKANGGISGAMAMSLIPEKFGYEKNAGMAVASYRNGFALAVGTKWEVSEKAVTKFSLSIDNKTGAGVGAGISIGIE